LHDSDNGIWYKPGYEEVSAKKLKTILNAHQPDLLVASMPEPYYLFINIPTQSVADKSPFIFADIPTNSKLTIVDDEGMRAIFPSFDNFINKNLTRYKTTEYWVGEPLRYTTSIKSEQKPVKVYQLKYSELQKILAANN
jgi:hypothetical protein